MRSRTGILIVIAIGFILLVFCQPKFLPFPAIVRLREYAQNFDPVKNPNGKDVFEVCKSVEDTDTDFMTKFTLAFHKKDMEYSDSSHSHCLEGVSLPSRKHRRNRLCDQ
jgi:hypothetical protein